jgi:4-hydroxy-3-methylbut-2-enyl diphosphate reductase
LGLLSAFFLGALPFWTLLAMSLLGLSYNFWFLPKNLFIEIKYRRMRDIPGSKTILIALAWGVVTTGVPALSSENAQLPGSLFAMIWAIGIVFCRTAFFDMLDIQGDRIVGKETLPILLGTKNTLKLLKKILILLIVSVLLLGASGLFSGLAYALAVCPLLLLLIIKSHEKDDTLPGARIEFKVESIFLLAGLMTVGYLYI